MEKTGIHHSVPVRDEKCRRKKIHTANLAVEEHLAVEAEEERTVAATLRRRTVAATLRRRWEFWKQSADANGGDGKRGR
ncbi:hypothetical protein L1887_26241 [Cichorium endivia]|nr:hypothetical protein L1887_26241 [Cichorium endivia]